MRKRSVLLLSAFSASLSFYSLPSLAQPAPEELHRRKLERLKTYIIANTENVGRQFPEVARRIHYGEEEGRGIRGQVTPAEAEELQEEGVPAISIPDGIKLADEVH